MNHLYTDGGCIQKNPSPYGGTWAWCLVEENHSGGRLITHQSGTVLPGWYGCPVLTNNQTELLAAVMGLEAVKDSVILCTDSLITKCRIKHGNPSWKGVPKELVERARAVRHLAAAVELLAGHPTKKQLLNGSKNGVRVSRWNRYCDELCKAEAARALSK